MMSPQASDTRVAQHESATLAHNTVNSSHWKNDFLASIVVFFVALPLCMGIAVASGFPPERAASAGILTGIIGGIVVGWLSGCPLQVSGPAAGLAVTVGQYVTQFGFGTLAIIIMIAGAIQVAAGYFRLGQWFRAVSPAVIQGMLAGIGVLILAAQFHVMVDDVPPGSGKEFGGIHNLLTIPVAVWKGLSMDIHRPAALLGVFTIVVVILWAAISPPRVRFIPAPLVGVTAATIVAQVLTANVKYIGIPENLWEAIVLPPVEEWRSWLDWSVLGAGITVAFIASAESLLTATAVDAMQNRAKRTRYDKELVAQGVGNLLSGLVGGLPLTGVIVRSSANVLAGARTRWSTILHGFWLLIFAAMMPHVLRLIPVASLAAILVYTGWKLMNPKAARTIASYGRGELAIYAATLSTVVIFDLLSGILVGMVLAVLKLLFTFSCLTVSVVRDEDASKAHMYLRGAATFVRLPKLADALINVPEGVELHVHFEDLTYIDHACLDLLMNWEKQHRATGGSLVIDWNELTTRFWRGNGQTGTGEALRDPDKNGTVIQGAADRKPEHAS